MTPKEKAKNLVHKFIEINGNRFFAKECSMIVVDEIIDSMQYMNIEYSYIDLKYWNDVKREIDQL